MLAPGVSLVEPWAAAAQHVIAEHNLTTGDLRIPGLKRPFFGKAERPLFARAGGFSLTPRHPDELTPKRFKVVVAFDLPRGSYATVVLRALGQ